MSHWTELVTDNPVIKESHRSFGQQMNPKNWPTNTSISVAIVGVVYFVIIALALQSVRDIDASVFSYVSLTCCILASAVVLYGTLAGEREKRTLDLLLVAPVTAGQIIAAKMMKAAVPVIVIVGLLVVPSIVFGVVRQSLGLQPLLSAASFPIFMAGSVLLVFSVSVFVGGVAIFVSLIERTTARALTGTLAVLFLVYIVYAVMGGVVGTFNPKTADWMMAIHPYRALVHLNFPTPTLPAPMLVASVTSALHLAAGAALTTWASKNINRERLKGMKPNA